ncbi:unnamed protein product [Schistosoma margrebowiei]|uniref:Peptidase S54 rhomboid domain-containing protein n=1 Tax=Schistosoma margrebowiei TaxID=48269 RepID=A0A183MBD0_9TREM|nr:unnamed protein product [Schistosoma margrebowiei]
MAMTFLIVEHLVYTSSGETCYCLSLVFFLMISLSDISFSSGFPIDSILIYNPTKRHELWRFLTYMFIHYGYKHLVFNCLVQIVLGLLLELVHKFWRVGLVYLLGVISGNILIMCQKQKKQMSLQRVHHGSKLSTYQIILLFIYIYIYLLTNVFCFLMF